MAAPMYFQWQNPVLLKTIYPRRNRKLADFLIYCREIELWEEYKDKDIKDLEEEVKVFIAEREYYNGSFIVYLPDGPAPAGDLKDMLDWNKILRR
jgi:hypothetical protein